MAGRWCIHLNDGDVVWACSQPALSCVCLKFGDILCQVSQYFYALENTLLAHFCPRFHWSTLCEHHLLKFLHLISHNPRILHVLVHLVQLFLKLACRSKGPNIPCSNCAFFLTEFGSNSIFDIPALMSDVERGRCDQSGMDILSFVADFGGVSWAYI